MSNPATLTSSVALEDSPLQLELAGMPRASSVSVTNSANQSCATTGLAPQSSETLGISTAADTRAQGYLAEAFPASHFPERTLTDKERRTLTDTSGLRCIESFMKLAQPTCWQRMFLGSLILKGGWFSKLCSLTWRLKATTCSRLLFQLVPKVHSIDVTDCGYAEGSGRKRSHRKEVVKFRESEPPHRQGCDAGQVREVLARPRDTEERHSRDVANTNQVNADSGRHGASQILKQEPPSLQGSKRYRAKKDAAYPQSKGTEPNHRRVGQGAQGASGGEKPDTLKDATHPHQVRSQGEWPNCQEEGQAGLCCGGEVKDTESGLGFMAYGIPSGILGHQGWGREPEDLPRVSVDIKMRSQKLSALGNAIVPQVAEEIIRHFTM